MAGLNKKLYTAFICTLVGKIKDYATKWTYSVNFPHQLSVETNEHSGARNAAIYISARTGRDTPFSARELESNNINRFFGEDLDTTGLAEILKYNQSVYFGLLLEPPIYYTGDTTIAVGLNTYVNKYPAKTLSGTGTSVATSFLSVKEIPNKSFGDYLVPAISGAQKDTTKYCDGLYWPSYERFTVKEAEGQVTSTYSNKAYTRFGESYLDEIYTINQAQSAGEFLLYDEGKYEDSETNDWKFYAQVYNENAVFVGENTDAFDWPTVTCFGFFNTKNSKAVFREETISGTKYLIDEGLTYWGEIIVNDKWYHKTKDNSPISGKTYYTRSGEPGSYTWNKWDGSTTWVKADMWEQTGIIVEPSQGGLISKNKFLIKWDGDIISNDFTLPTA